MKNNASLVYNVFLVLADAFALTLAFTIAYILRVSLSHEALSANVQSNTYISILISLLPFWILIFALLGPILLAGGLSMQQMVLAQRDYGCWFLLPAALTACKLLPPVFKKKVLKPLPFQWISPTLST